MRKVFKTIIRIIEMLILYLIIFIAIDCIRLQKGDFGAKPLITINKQEEWNENKELIYGYYRGLGYKVEYSYVIEEEKGDTTVNTRKKAEFKLFDKILIWAWIE